MAGLSNDSITNDSTILLGVFLHHHQNIKAHNAQQLWLHTLCSYLFSPVFLFFWDIICRSNISNNAFSHIMNQS